MRKHVKHDEQGREIVDRRKVAVPVKFRRNERTELREIIRSEVSDIAAKNEAETFEEANDFDIADDVTDIVPSSVHEVADDDDAFNEYAATARLDDRQKLEYLNKRYPQPKKEYRHGERRRSERGDDERRYRDDRQRSRRVQTEYDDDGESRNYRRRQSDSYRGGDED